MKNRCIKILSIGNSFSQDAQAYLHDLAHSGGIETKNVNLYIGGCPLQRHWANMQSGAAEYSLEINGESTGRYVSIKEALTSDQWDVVTLQQASGDSGMEETYEPALSRLSQAVKQIAPQAQQWMHQTWAYEIDSTHEAFARYGNDQQAMYRALSQAYRKASAAIGAPILPCGDVLQKLRGQPEFDYAHRGQTGAQSLCRDGFHLDLLYGRYAAAAVWYVMLLGGRLEENGFLPRVDGKTPDIHKIQVIKRVVGQTCAEEVSGRK